MVDDTLEATEEVVEVETAEIADVLAMAMRTGKLRGLPRPRGLRRRLVFDASAHTRHW